MTGEPTPGGRADDETVRLIWRDGKVDWDELIAQGVYEPKGNLPRRHPDAPSVMLLIALPAALFVVVLVLVIAAAWLVGHIAPACSS